MTVFETSPDVHTTAPISTAHVPIRQCIHFGVIDSRSGHRRACRAAAVRKTSFCRLHQPCPSLSPITPDRPLAEKCGMVVGHDRLHTGGARMWSDTEASNQAAVGAHG